jgi:tRNA pseudouridine38-40 synthase
VVSFPTRAERAPDGWRRGISSQTPHGVGVVWAKVLGDAFDARFDALWRRYCYVYCDARAVPVIHRGQVAWSAGALDAQAMQRAAQCLVGERDFSSFRAAACQSKSPWRRVLSVDVSRRRDLVAIDISANAFVMHMVRNIAGALREVGAGNMSAGAFKDMFELRDRTLAPPTAPPQGLYLVDVGYPHWPAQARLPAML